MKLTINKKQIYLIAISTLLMMFYTNILVAEGDPDYVIISGQVTNIERGIAIENHSVFIKSNSIKEGRGSSYFNTVITDHEGYYYDTIYTTENKGSFEVYTYDFAGESIDTTVHFRIIEKGNNYMIANFSIYLPYQAWKLQAKFRYSEVMDDAGLNKFNFIDLTENTNIISWQWDFGDGHSSKIQNPDHSYSSYGLFIVRLTVTALVNNIPKTSTVSKQIHISERTYCHIGGHVFSDYFPIDMGTAYLYFIDSLSRYFPIDTVAFDTLGYYYFYQIPVGNYLVKAEPMIESEYYGYLLPTYYGDELFWDEAELIKVSQTSWEYNIMLTHSEGALAGTGNISGNIEYVELSKSYEGLSAHGINIYLIDESDNLLTCHYSDEYGNFLFDDIELETYWLYPEVTGIPSNKIKVELTPVTPHINNVNITIHPDGISFIFPVDDFDLPEEVGLPYPNPASGIMHIPLSIGNNKNASYEIIDMYGGKVFSDNIDLINSNSFEIATSHFKNGTYILRTELNDKTYERIFVVIR